ncbi:MAG: nucleoside hydrolase [Phenylobacterium zucineum]|nr:MAG: nucleoside hydrolase [Phenylobacterium zucineum]
MTKTSLIFDCDPGVDDAIALFLAFAARDEVDLLGVTTVAGNVAAALTARNACILREIAQREDVPVAAGCERPMVRAPIDAGHFHGQTGLGDLPISTPQKGVEAIHGVDFIINAVMSRPSDTVTVAVTGPMTNLAMAMVKEPRLSRRLARIIAMGGARSEGGNITASAEYNIYADPHAAQVVAESGTPLVMMGLDVTHQVRAAARHIDAIAAIGGPVSKACVNLFGFMDRTEKALASGGDAPQHDLCPMAYLLAPTLFTLRPCRMEVETSSPLTSGHTAVDFRHRDSPQPHIKWAISADADGIFALLTDHLSR